MSNWEEVIEEGRVFWINDEVGSIMKSGEGMYFGFLPKVLKLGPFTSKEEAQRAMTQNLDTLNALVENFNRQLIDSQVQ